MALVLRKTVLPRNITLLKCLKGRPISSAPNKLNPAPILEVPSLARIERKRSLTLVGLKKLGKTRRPRCVRQAFRRRTGAMVQHSPTRAIANDLDQATTKFGVNKPSEEQIFPKTPDNFHFATRDTASKGFEQVCTKWGLEVSGQNNSDLPHSTDVTYQPAMGGSYQASINWGPSNQTPNPPQTNDQNSFYQTYNNSGPYSQTSPYSSSTTNMNGFYQTPNYTGTNGTSYSQTANFPYSNSTTNMNSGFYQTSNNTSQGAAYSNSFSLPFSASTSYISTGFCPASNNSGSNGTAYSQTFDLPNSASTRYINNGFNQASYKWQIPRSHDHWEPYSRASDKWGLDDRYLNATDVLKKFSQCGASPEVAKQMSVCGAPACCPPSPGYSPPCPNNQNAECQQEMTGYYYYPHGMWYDGPYHVTNLCIEGGPISVGEGWYTPYAVQPSNVNVPLYEPEPEEPEKQEEIVECVKYKKTDQEIVKESLDILGSVKREVLKE